nr:MULTISPECIES: cyclophilin-like fold protein [unclassified Siphonobacter]
MIQMGDLMLYGSYTLVLFYEYFRTSYAYTRLGKIDHPAALAAALESGDISISFQIE